MQQWLTALFLVIRMPAESGLSTTQRGERQSAITMAIPGKSAESELVTLLGAAAARPID